MLRVRLSSTSIPPCTSVDDTGCALCQNARDGNWILRASGGDSFWNSSFNNSGLGVFVAQPIAGLHLNRAGDAIVATTSDGVAPVWRVPTGKRQFACAVPDRSLGAMALSPDWRRVASAVDDGTVHVWELATGAQLAIYSGHSATSYVIAFGSGDTALSAERRAIHVWSAQTGAHPNGLTDPSEVITSAVACDAAGSSSVICSCDFVCSCDSVCICDSVCSSNAKGGGGGGGHYWYPN